MRRLLLSVLVLTLLSAIQPTMAQTSKDEAKLLKRFENYFTKYKPKGTRLTQQPRMVDCQIDRVTKTLTITADEFFAAQEFTPEITASIYKKLKGELTKPFKGYRITVVTNGMTIEELIPNRLSQNADKSRMWGNIDYDGEPWVKNISAPVKFTHGLQGRHLSLWSSHGRFYDQKRGCWRWQRPKLFGTTEDLFTQTIVLPYLIPMLEQSGAIVFTPRERDWQKEEIIVDNDAPYYYKEVVAGDKWRTTSQRGFAWHAGNYHDNENPFEAGTARMVKTTGSKSRNSTAIYQPKFRKAGRYAVYVSYQTLPNSVDDVLYTVWHRGEKTQFHVNQQMGGGTWVYLGTFDFDAGSNEFNCVIVSNQSNKKGMVTTDAVRFGGGMGNIERFGTTSGLPRSLEGARYSAQWAGMPYQVYSSKNGQDDYADDINVRSHMTNLLGGGSCYMPTIPGRKVPIELSLAIHSDAGYTRDGRTHTGTLSICTTYLNDSIFRTGRSRLSSRDFADELLTSVSGDMARKYGSWPTRELYDRNYSESRCPGVPSAILETMSHQNFWDMRYGQDPNFRFDFARSVYKAILRYVSRMHHTKYVVSPLTPNRLRVELTGKGGAKVSWNPVKDNDEPTAEPTGYIVYTAIGKNGFDNGIYVKGKNTSVVIDIEPEQLYSFYVTAVNEGGESFPSEVVSCYDVPEAQKRVLIVNGFHRLASPAVRNNAAEQGFDMEMDPGVTYGRTAGWLGYQVSFDKTKMGSERRDGLGYTNDSLMGQFIAGNDFNYIRTHAEAIASAQRYSIASCSSEALETNDIRPTEYQMMDLILGLEKNDGWSLREYQAFTPMIRQHLQLFTKRGGALLVSGSYIGSDMAMPAERRYLEDVLKLTYEGVNSDSLQRDTIQGLGTTFEFYRQLNETHYAATHPEILQPVAPAFPAMAYKDGYSACVAYDGKDYKAMTMGFPFECIKDEQKRLSLMRGILSFLLRTK